MLRLRRRCVLVSTLPSQQCLNSHALAALSFQELRRGADPALVHSIAFSRGCEWLAVSSDKSTVQVFALADHVVTGPPLGAANSSGQFFHFFVSINKSTVHVLALADHVVTGPPLGATNSSGQCSHCFASSWRLLSAELSGDVVSISTVLPFATAPNSPGQR